MLAMWVAIVALPLRAQFKYGVTPVSLAGYEQSLKANSEKELVNLATFIPGVVLDIRYATTNNFTGERIYSLARAYARRPVAEALKRAQHEFNKRGYAIKIFDAYRPYSATVKFYEVMKGDTTYVANPYKGSRHNRGCAIDMTLVDMKTGEELKMPTGYDAMQKESWPSTAVTDPVVRENRKTLISIMEHNGFTVYATEWWHFDFTGWAKYDVMNIDFEELEKH